MNWLKDNLIAILGVACLILGLGWLISHYVFAANLAEAREQLAAAQASVTLAASANETNLAAIKTLKDKNDALIAKQEADKAAAAEAARRVEELREELGRTVAANAALRQKMAKENPDVDAYLRGGMPCDLARQLWGKQAGYCAD